MISKIIWQTHEREYEDLDDSIKYPMNTWKFFNNGWEHRYASADQRLKDMQQLAPHLVDYYLASHPVNQADMWRYFIVQEHGGVYADTDSICFMGLDEILADYMEEDFVSTPPSIGFNFWIRDEWDIAAKRGRPWIINNAIFAASPNSKILAKVIESMEKFCRTHKDGEFFFSMHLYSDILTWEDNVPHKLIGTIHDKKYNGFPEGYEFKY
jgi:mannosyltransferase OCH1-like enzyme